MIKFTVTHDLAKGYAATEALRSLINDKKALNATVEVAAEGAVKEHLTTHYAGRVNRLGGTSTGYWKRAIENTTGTSDAAGATISINQTGIRLKYEGGVIRPSGKTSEVTGKPIRFLSIPVHPAAHGRTIADLGGKSAFYVVPFAAGGGFSEGGTGAAAGVFRQSGGKRSDSDPLYFILKRSVTIKADRNLLPSEDAVGTAITEALRIYFSPGTP